MVQTVKDATVEQRRTPQQQATDDDNWTTANWRQAGATVAVSTTSDNHCLWGGHVGAGDHLVPQHSHDLVSLHLNIVSPCSHRNTTKPTRIKVNVKVLKG